MRWAVIVFVLLFVFAGALWLFQRKLIYPGAWMSFAASPPPAEQVERWEIPIDGGAVEAWLLPGEGVTAERPGPVVVFLHGNGEIIDQWAQELSWYTDRGISVLLPEYRGYGRSAGKPSQKAIVEDVRAFTDRLLGLDTVDSERLIVHGRSLGGGFAAQLVESHQPAALILGSSFTSLPDAAQALIPVPKFFVRDKLEVENVLRGYNGAALIVHGEDDTVIPVSHARRNAAVAKNSTLVVYERTGHNNMPRGHGRWEDIELWLVSNQILHDGPVSGEIDLNR